MSSPTPPSRLHRGPVPIAPRVGLKTLAGLCRRLAIATESGIDVRRTFAREAERNRGRLRRNLQRISDDVAAGRSVTEAFARTGGYFPPMFREMVEVGEETGSLAEVLRRLADHYEHQVQLRRIFLRGITWPLMQLAAAVVIVGLVIWLVGLIAQSRGAEPIDLLGFGLVGTEGLITYAVIVGAAIAAVAVLVWGVRRGLFWTRPLQRAVLKIPGIGGPLRTIALARAAWTLSLTLNVEMDIRRSLELALRSTRNDRFLRSIDPISAELAAGSEIHEALRGSGAFPPDFVDAFEVGEQSGRLAETMARLSRQYEEQARAALDTLTRFAGFAVWALVAVLIVFLIFRLASFYLGAINDAMRL